jgi:hypothetical protein
MSNSADDKQTRLLQNSLVAGQSHYEKTYVKPPSNSATHLRLSLLELLWKVEPVVFAAADPRTHSELALMILELEGYRGNLIGHMPEFIRQAREKFQASYHSRAPRTETPSFESLKDEQKSTSNPITPYLK